jgi:hypothetical protein
MINNSAIRDDPQSPQTLLTYYGRFPRANDAVKFKLQAQRAAWRDMDTQTLSNLLVSIVELDQTASLYFSVHTHVRGIVYTSAFIAETIERDRPQIRQIIDKQYYPRLIRAFAAWERAEGRAITRQEVRNKLLENAELRAAVCELVISWLEQEAFVMFVENNQSRFKRLNGY